MTEFGGEKARSSRFQVYGLCHGEHGLRVDLTGFGVGLEWLGSI